MARLLTWLGHLAVALGVAAGGAAIARSLGVGEAALPPAGPLVGTAVGAIICGAALTLLGLTLWSEADKRLEADLL